MSFDLFVQSCIILKRMTDVFKRYDDDRDGYITLSFEEFLTGEWCFVERFLPKLNNPCFVRLRNFELIIKSLLQRSFDNDNTFHCTRFAISLSPI